jgi:hypothetical protein
MTYVLREQVQNRYYHKDGKIIEFDTKDEATTFLQNFARRANVLALASTVQGNPVNIFDVQQVIQSTVVEEKLKECTCGFINFKDIDR